MRIVVGLFRCSRCWWELDAVDARGGDGRDEAVDADDEASGSDQGCEGWEGEGEAEGEAEGRGHVDLTERRSHWHNPARYF